MEVIVSIKNISKSFRRGEQQELLVLEKVNFDFHEGEIIALLGKSGSGKSTLLRIIAGLIQSTGGEVRYRDQLVRGPVRGMAMVFQNFALMPWLTVFQNVELGLEALGISRSERRSRALAAIDMVGLDGFESAYPRELSGGMRQRVGFARALVVNPDILLMDEPFSALDVLTAENLRGDLLDLWQSRKIDTKGILFVTHSIEEAVLIADRILIFGSDPGYVRAELNITMAQPRNETAQEFRDYVDEIYTLMTTRPRKKVLESELAYRLPDADVSELAGMMETLADQEYGGRADLPELAETLQLDVDDLFPLTEVLELLGFAKVSKGDIELAPSGMDFANADILARKQIFSQHLLAHVPLAKHIVNTVKADGDQRVTVRHFTNEMKETLSDQEAERVLKVVIEWGRYAEIFAYDHNAGVLSLENPD